MTPELKAKWLADLRSGNYHKTTSHLKDNLGYCCLGVLCETAGFSLRAVNGGYAPERADGESVNDGNELSEHGLILFGLTRTEHDKLIHINDTSDTFEYVANYIERHVNEE